jgi:hypothetical protein
MRSAKGYLLYSEVPEEVFFILPSTYLNYIKNSVSFLGAIRN